MAITHEQLAEITASIAPKIRFEELQQMMAQHVEIGSDGLYARLDGLASRYTPSAQDKYEATWASFYLPVKRSGRVVCTAISLFRSYKKTYSLTCGDIYRSGGITVSPGTQDVPAAYALMVEELLRFLPLVDVYGDELLQTLYPYDWRVGRIKRKYVCDPTTLLSQEEGDRLLAAYAAHQKQSLSISEISLNDYLQTAAICYQAAFPDDITKFTRQRHVETLSPRQLHQYWADRRHGGMLELEDPDSPWEFMQWYRSRTWEGAHPFEIVYSGNVHGISLDPPDGETPCYRLSVVDPFYRRDTLTMVAALIDHNVPFRINHLEELVDYCRGETFMSVNTTSLREETLRYHDTPEERENYFPHIEWEPVAMLTPQG